MTSANKRKAPRKKTCLCGCKEPVHCRGLALACYHATRRRVATGLVSWDELVVAGNALPARAKNECQRRNPHGAKIDRLIAARGG